MPRIRNRSKRITRKKHRSKRITRKKVVFKKSTNTKKKYMAVFYEGSKKVKTTHFGASGMSDYTKHRDEARKQRYIKRHRTNENWSNYMSAGALSRWILWNQKTLKASKADYKRRFKLD